MVDLDGDSIVDYAYAGDLQGNMWKFNLTSTNAANWDVAFMSSGTKSAAVHGDRLRRCPPADHLQARSGPRTEGVGMIVLFGTGKFMEPATSRPRRRRPSMA